MNDLITAVTSGLFVEVGKVIEHMKAQQERIADLERQLAEASAPAVEQDKVICANLGELLLTPAQRKAADTDKVREALNKLHSDIMNIPCNALHAASPSQEVQRAYKEGHRDSRHAAAELAASMAAQAPVREVPDKRLQNWIDLIHDNERSMGDRLQSLSSTFAGLLNGDAVDKYPLRAIREQLEGEPLHAIFVPDYWRKVDEHGNPPDGLYMAIYKGDDKSLPVALVAYGKPEFDNDDEEDGEEECGAPEFCWTEYQEDRDGDIFLIVREVIAYLPVNLDMKSLEAVRAALPAAPVHQEGA